MLVIPKSTMGKRGGSAYSKGRQRTKGYLSAKMEAFARCLTIHGMSGLDSYRQAYPATKMSDKAVTTEASRLKQHPLVSRRINELNTMLVEVDLHDRAQADSFVMAGLKRLALNGDSSAAQLGAYKLIGHLSHTRFFDKPAAGATPDLRTADAIRSALQHRVARLLPAPPA